MGIADTRSSVERERSHALLGGLHVQEMASCVHHCGNAEVELGSDSVDLIYQLFDDDLLRFGLSLQAPFTQQKRAGSKQRLNAREREVILSL